METMATGLPALATEVGGNAELVQAAVTGGWVSSGEVDVMALALVRLCAERRPRPVMGLQARQRAQDRFSLDAMVQAYAHLYSRELGSPPLGAC